MIRIGTFKNRSISGMVHWIVFIVATLIMCMSGAYAEYIENSSKLLQITDDGKSTMMSVSPDGKKILYLLEIAGTQTLRSSL